MKTKLTFELCNYLLQVELLAFEQLHKTLCLDQNASTARATICVWWITQINISVIIYPGIISENIFLLVFHGRILALQGWNKSP